MMKYLPCFRFDKIRIICLFLGMVLLYTGEANAQSQYLNIAKSLERQHEYEPALVVYQQIYSTNKNDINVIRGIKNCYQGLQQYDKLIDFLQRARRITPKNLYIPSYLAEAYFQINERDQAMLLWKNHLNNHPKDIAVYRIVASSMIAMRMFDDAIEVYKLAMANIGSQFNLHMDIVNLSKIQLKYGEATDHLLQYYMHSPKQFNYIQRQILNLADEKDQLPEIIKIIDQYAENYPELIQIQEIQANLHIKEKNFESAFEIYQRLENKKSNGSYLVKFANAAKENHAVEYTLKAYQVILERYPDSPFAGNASVNIAQAHMLLAYQKREAGRFESAGTEIQKAIRIYDSLTVHAANPNQQIDSYNQLGGIYAQYYYDLDKSIYYYNKYIGFQRKGVPRDGVLIKLGDVYLKKNLLSDADKTYAMVTRKEYTALTSFKRAEILYFKGQFKEALNKIDALQKSVSIQDGLYNDILERRQLLESFAQDSRSLQQFGQAELLIYQQKKSEAAEILSHLARSEKKISTIAGRIGGKLYLELDQPEESRDLLQYLRGKYPDDIHVDEILFYLARTEEYLGEYNRALDLYTKIITQYSTSLYLSEARDQARRMTEQLNKAEI